MIPMCVPQLVKVVGYGKDGNWMQLGGFFLSQNRRVSGNIPFTLWQSSMAIENPSFMDDMPSYRPSIYREFRVAMLDDTRGKPIC
jgi:hypothetical protein